MNVAPRPFHAAPITATASVKTTLRHRMPVRHHEMAPDIFATSASMAIAPEYSVGLSAGPRRLQNWRSRWSSCGRCTTAHEFTLRLPPERLRLELILKRTCSG